MMFDLIFSIPNRCAEFAFRRPVIVIFVSSKNCYHPAGGVHMLFQKQVFNMSKCLLSYMLSKDLY